MKTKFIKCFACLTMIFSLLAMPVRAEYDSLTPEEITKISNAVKNQVFDIEGIVINIESIDILYDIEMNPSYVYVLTDTGYFIATRENCSISEGVLDTQELPYAEMSDRHIPIYAGPSSYAGHWVVAYQYSYKNSTAGKFYKVVDNHGRYNAVINVGWTAGAVWMVR